MKKAAVLAQIRAEKIVGLVRALDGPDLIDCARALSAAGIHTLEVATTTPAVLAALAAASAALPDFHFGLGTVLDVETARLGILAGASLIVTPAPRPEVITLCRRYQVPVISAAFTPAEVASAHAAGSDAVKVIPGERFGPAYIQSLHTAHPSVPLIPLGGVTAETIAEFLRAGAIAAIAGSSLLEPACLDQKDWPALTERARRFVRAVELIAAKP